MAWRPVVFFAVQAIACLYAARRGGAPERITAAAMAIAALATAFPSQDPKASFRAVQWQAFGPDLFLLVVLIGVVCAANRYWPIWIAALHLDTIAVHAVRVIDPMLLPSVYAASTGWAAYPMIVMLIVGTTRHQQRAASKADPDWSPLRR